MALAIETLTPDRWQALEELFRDGCACSRCWCMYWRIGPAYRRRSPERNQADFRKIVERGPPPGLIALLGDRPVGWCQLTRRALVPYVHDLHGRRIGNSEDDQRVWALTCFQVRSDRRRSGVTGALVDRALAHVRLEGGHALEAYPVEADVSPSASGTGYASTFARAGFRILARRRKGRPVMRFDFVEGTLLPGIERSELPAMTVNERLFATGLIDRWDIAVRGRDRAGMIRLLGLCGIEGGNATTDQVLADPARYGF